MKLGSLVIRGVVGPLFVGHGAQKLFGAFGGHGPEGTGQFFEQLGLRPGRHHAIAAGVAEFAGGLMLTLGKAHGGYVGTALALGFGIALAIAAVAVTLATVALRSRLTRS